MITVNIFITAIQNTFSDTKYRKWYISLISKALNRVNYTLPAHKKQALMHLEKIERHHICPKSIFPEYKNDKNNLAYMSPKEHFVAHLLLYKMSKKDSKHVCSMAFAVSKMRQNNYSQSRILNSNEYNFVRRAAIDANKNRIYKTGYKQSLEIIAKRVQTYHKNYSGHSLETKQKLSFIAKNRIVSEETRKKMSLSRKGKSSSMKGKTHSESTKKLLSKKLSGRNHPLYGVVRSKETRDKLSRARKGKYTGNENGMFGRKHNRESILLMTINKIKHKIKNVPYDLNLTTWYQFVLDVQRYSTNKTKKEICEHFGISRYILSQLF